MHQATRPDVTPGSAPDFLYIGAPRTGSTWLYLNLQRHPDVWVPPCKSIIYFHPRFQRYRLKKLGRFWQEALLNGDRDTRAWYRSYFARPLVDDRWYLSLFPQGQIAGEVAEAYCSLPRDRVRKIHRLLPHVKIIFTLRNPVERALSQAKMGLISRQNRRIDEVSDDEFVAHIDRAGSQARSRYTDTLDTWNSLFSNEQFLIMFYDHLVQDVQNYLSEICRFLGVQFRRDYFEATINTRAYKSIDSPLSPPVLKHAARTYRGEVEELAGRFGGYARQWQRKVEEILE